MIGTINQDNLYLIIPGKIVAVANFLKDENDTDILVALDKIYKSNMYKKLSDEKTKFWTYGPVALYEELKDELKKLTITKHPSSQANRGAPQD